MKLLVSGSTGLVGAALVRRLQEQGHSVLRLARFGSPVGEPAIRWDPNTDRLAAARLEGLDQVVHLAGENIAGRRWTPIQQARIRASRIRSTELLCATLARLARPPAVVVCASAVGYYGDRGDEVLREDSPPGQGFLPEVCQAWEEAAAPARDRAIRVVHLRLGMVLSRHGGALPRMLLPFKLGAGGRIGSGRQYVSWITLEDVVGAILHALAINSLDGPVNAVAPNPVTNAEFTRALGRALRRPALLPLPAFAARLALGSMADELLLASARAEPARLLDTGYAFAHPHVETALRHVLGRL